MGDGGTPVPHCSCLLAYFIPINASEPMRLVTLTPQSVAAVKWLLLDGTIATTRISEKQYWAGQDAWDRPSDGAIFCCAHLIPAVDTDDGYRLPGDCFLLPWKEEKEPSLVVDVAGDPLLFWDYSAASADDPATNGITHAEYEAFLDTTGLPPLDLAKVTGDGTGQYSRKTGLLLQPIGNAVRLVPGAFDLKNPEKAAYAPTVPSLTVQRINTISPNHHSVAFDAHATTDSALTSGLTFAHVMSASANGYLNCTTGVYNVAGGTISGVTYAAASATALGPDQAILAGAQGYANYFYKKSPATGTNNIVATPTHTNSQMSACSQSATGVDQTTPHTDAQTATGLSTAPMVTFNSATGELGVGGCCFATNGSGTEDGAWTPDDNVAASVDVGNLTAHIAGAATLTRTVTLSLSQSWVIFGVSLKAAGGASFLPTEDYPWPGSLPDLTRDVVTVFS